MLRITYGNLYYALCLGCWAFFGSLVLEICKRTSCAQVNESPKSYCGDNQEDRVFSWLHIYYALLASVRFQRFRCPGPLMTTYIMLFVWLVAHSLVYWYQQFLIVHHVLEFLMDKFFHDYIYIMLILLLWDLSRSRRGRSLMTTYIMLLAWFVELSLFHWRQLCGTVLVPELYYVPKCMSCDTDIVVMIGKADCFHDYVCFI